MAATFSTIAKNTLPKNCDFAASGRPGEFSKIEKKGNIACIDLYLGYMNQTALKGKKAKQGESPDESLAIQRLKSPKWR